MSGTVRVTDSDAGDSSLLSTPTQKGLSAALAQWQLTNKKYADECHAVPELHVFVLKIFVKVTKILNDFRDLLQTIKGCLI
jgi:hypothetical protein